MRNPTALTDDGRKPPPIRICLLMPRSSNRKYGIYIIGTAVISTKTRGAGRSMSMALHRVNPGPAQTSGGPDVRTAVIAAD